MLNLITTNNWEQTKAQHEVLLKQIKQNLCYGDWKEVAKRTGLHKDNCSSSFRRTHSKNHSLVVDTLLKVINERIEKLKVN